MNKHTKQLVTSALLAGCIAICSQIQLPLPYIPINLALLAVHLTGVFLKPKYACLTILVYITLGLIGLPVFANFSGGAQILFGPTGGYIVGYLFDSLIISYGIELFKASSKSIIILVCLGTFACYIFGTAWFIFVTHMSLSSSLMYCVIPFIPGDLIKIIIVSFLNKRLKLERI